MNTSLVKTTDSHKRSQHKYMAKHETLCVTLSKENDKDIIEWLRTQENRSDSVRRVLRDAINIKTH